MEHEAFSKRNFTLVMNKDNQSGVMKEEIDLELSEDYDFNEESFRKQIIRDDNTLGIHHIASLNLRTSPQTPRTLVECSLRTPGPKSLHATAYVTRNRLFADTPRVAKTPVKERPLVNVNPYTPESLQASRKLSGSVKRPSSSEEVDDDNLPSKKLVLHESSISRYHREFHEVGLIGRGTFGCVYKCINRLDGCTYAIKRSRRPISGSLQEHAHVVRYYSAWSEDGHMIIQNEFCNGGSLLDALQSCQHGCNYLKETELKRVLLHVAKGLKFMHDSSLVHMDIKPGNIFLSYKSCSSCSSGSEEEEHTFRHVIYKIGDLGHVTSICNPVVEEGDCRYLPKEILEEDYRNLPKADIFALGMTLIEAGGGKPLPKNGDEWHELRKAHVPDFPQCSQQFKDLLCLMIHPNPEQRPSSFELLQHKAVVRLPNKNRNELCRELNAERLKNEWLSRQLTDIVCYFQGTKKSQCKPKLLVGRTCRKSSSNMF